jgi:L-threonylcarbamoyladenylate synthase
MIGDDIDVARQLLRRGMLVAIPTETVYGLAGNALDEKAVSEIFAVKQRPSFNPLIIHLPNIEAFSNYVTEFPERLKLLADKFMPGPLSLLLKKKDTISDLVTAGSDYVAVRIPDHELARQLLQQIDFPLAAPSANPFGYVSPTTAQHVEDQLGDKLAYILDGGACDVGIESTIVGEENGQIVVYRKGGVSIEAIMSVVGDVIINEHSNSQPLAPGMLSSHYSPTKPIYLGNLDTLVEEFKNQNYAIISFCSFNTGLDSDRQFVLSITQDYREAARNLFQMLRTIDKSNFDIILAELLPDEDLGRAINDRLKRAAFQYNHK